MSGSYFADQGNCSLKIEETKLRLGLPGACGGGHIIITGDTASKTTGKRGFAKTTTDLKLNLAPEAKKKISEEIDLLPRTNDPGKPTAPKAQALGWPPVRSSRKNMLAVQVGKDATVVKESGADQTIIANSVSSVLVKVSMDGAPYLRKIDLKLFKSYHDLSFALDNMFGSFTVRKCGSSEGINRMRDYMNERKMEGSEYVPTYEDKDGDWMLVGDVPWEMFVDSCKRLRIMKGSEAINGPVPIEIMENREKNPISQDG